MTLVLLWKKMSIHISETQRFRTPNLCLCVLWTLEEKKPCCFWLAVF